VDQHRSAGTYALEATGGLRARVRGAAEAAYAHRFSSEGPGFALGLRFPSPDPDFADYQGGGLGFHLDSLPHPGTYAARPVGVTWPSGLRRQRTVAVTFMSSSGAHMWRPLGGEVRFARTPGSRDGLRGAFRLRIVRVQGGPPDTAAVEGTFETR
jgi:hypothetical protein